jgi:hypothetical protein
VPDAFIVLVDAGRLASARDLDLMALGERLAGGGSLISIVALGAGGGVVLPGQPITSARDVYWPSKLGPADGTEVADVLEAVYEVIHSTGAVDPRIVVLPLIDWADFAGLKRELKLIPNVKIETHVLTTTSGPAPRATPAPTTPAPAAAPPARKKSRAEIRADDRLLRDVAIIFFTFLLCVTVFVPVWIGKTFFRDWLLHPAWKSVSYITVREDGTYFVTDMTMGWIAILVVSAILLFFGSWSYRGGRIFLGFLGLLVAFAIALPITTSSWDAAQATTVIRQSG